MALLPAEVFEARVTQTATLIFLHGLGDTGSGWAESLRSLVPPYCKLICPNARSMPVTLNFGMVMPAWYDLYGLGIDVKQDENGIASSANELAKFVEAEKNASIPPERIVVGGFSQGGSTALYYGLTNEEPKLGGLIALSGWLPLHQKFITDFNNISANRSLPILQCHGKADPIVPYELGELTNSVLRQLGFSHCSFCSYQGMGHCCCDREMSDVKEFLKQHLPKTD